MSNRKFQPFPNTHWSLVKRAGQADDAARREALEVLLKRYQPALKSYLTMVHKMPAEESEDLLQAFIADQILDRDLLRNADAKKGRFRSLLLTSLRNFATSRYRAQKVRATVPMPRSPLQDPSPTSQAVVEAAWARALINEVVHEMREECLRTNRCDVWAVFEERVLADIFGNARALPYGELAKQLKLSSPMQAANLLVTAKRMYVRLLRGAVGEYEQEPADIDQEIADLRRILAASPVDQGE